LYEAVGFESYGLEHSALRIGDHYVDEEHRALILDMCSRRTAPESRSG
jgi:hypothetical protein